MMTVNYRELSKELKRVQDEARSGLKNPRAISIERKDWFPDETVELGVNWAALGTMDAEETKNFAEALMKAANAVATFKYNGYKVIYGE